MQDKLPDRKARAAAKPGRLSDGGGLFLRVRHVDAKSWAFVHRSGGKWQEIGLGPYPAIALARARDIAAEMRTALAEGRDPKSLRDKESEPTFAEAVDRYLASMSGQWSNPKHRAQWSVTLGDAYCAMIRPKRVSTIETADILAVLQPVWTAKAETASRVRGRIEAVLDFAKARGWRHGDNPARWRGPLKTLLPARGKLTRGHHAALPYHELPAFVAALRELEAMSARALEFAILNASRSGEVLNARWSEIDPDAATWTIPPERMKARRPHVVPLAPRAITILRNLSEARTGDFVFPGPDLRKPLSSGAFAALLKRMKRDDLTAHGFRSAFRDWAGDETTFEREIAEAALAHNVGDATERAYRRGTALEKRRALMVAWADYCSGTIPRNVVALRNGT